MVICTHTRCFLLFLFFVIANCVYLVERNGLKLGLGDFVFYSVLVARAAMYDWITTVCCTIAVLTGLTATIFLLAIYKKALPALPISIAFGILFYFVAKTVLVPYICELVVFGMIGL